MTELGFKLSTMSVVRRRLCFQLQQFHKYSVKLQSIQFTCGHFLLAQISSTVCSYSAQHKQYVAHTGSLRG